MELHKIRICNFAEIVIKLSTGQGMDENVLW